MCGIVSYIGKENKAEQVLLDGLKSLEYRGYDSAGIAILDESLSIQITKSVGKIADLELAVNALARLSNSNCGIGHTRWATHGEANQTNAHPHYPINDASVALVHNGIIKNYLPLKKELESRGVEFQTDTDTEVIVQLFKTIRSDLSADWQTEEGVAPAPDLDANSQFRAKVDRIALRETIKKLDGSYALALLTTSAGQQKKILVARNESPLVIGIGDDENFVASDSATVLQFTDKILRLNDLQIAEITAEAVNIEDLEGNTIRAEIQQLVRTASLMEKGAYKHFLLKEIHEQPAIISNMLKGLGHKQFESAALKEEQASLGDAGRILGSNYASWQRLDFDIRSINRIVIVACGSAYHAALLGKYMLEQWAEIPVETALASEYVTAPTLLTKNDLVIAVSQSGETADTLAAIRRAKSTGAHSIAITNKNDSAIVELCKPNVFLTPAGTEVSVASTKAFTSQVLSFYLFALYAAEQREILTLEELTQIKYEMNRLPQLLDQVIERSESFRENFVQFSEYRDFLFLSRGVNYPIALEGALKLKELSYIHATGYASGEMKHGPIAILDHNVPVLSIAVNGDTEIEQEIYVRCLHNAEEAKARKSPSIVIACDSNEDVEDIFDFVIRIPNVSQIFSPIIATIPLQFLAYYIAEDLGKDVDQPRNLAKSVTVE